MRHFYGFSKGEVILYSNDIGFGLVELLLRVDTARRNVLLREMLVSGNESVKNVGGVDGFGDEGLVIREQLADESVGADGEDGTVRARETVDVLGVADLDRAVERVDPVNGLDEEGQF